MGSVEMAYDWISTMRSDLQFFFFELLLIQMTKQGCGRPAWGPAGHVANCKTEARLRDPRVEIGKSILFILFLHFVIHCVLVICHAILLVVFIHPLTYYLTS